MSVAPSRAGRAILLSGTAVLAIGFAAVPAFAQDAAATAPQASAPAPAPAAAKLSEPQPGLGDIVVTARRRAEDLQKVPVAVTAIGTEGLRERKIEKASDLLFSSPSLSVQPNLQGRQSANFFIRGQGVATGGVLPSVVSYFGEVPLDINGGASFALNDLDSVQVLRGPQGTLFGRNANGGAVILTPKAPGQTTEGYVEGGYGNYNAIDFKAALTIPLTPTLGVRISGGYTKHDGYTHNLSGRDMDNLKSGNARMFLRWKPSDNFKDDLVYNFLRSTSNGMAGILDAVRPTSTAATFYPLPGLPLVRGTGLLNDLAEQQQLGPRTIDDPSTYWGEVNQIHMITNTAAYTTDGGVTFKNITGWERLKECASDPTASTYTNFYVSTCFQNYIADNAGIKQHYNNDSTQITNETNVSGKAFDNKLDWIAGAFFLWNNPSADLGHFWATRSSKSLFVANVTSFLHKDRSQAVYAQGTYAILPTLKFTGGVRYTWDQRTLQFGQVTSQTNGFNNFQCVSPGLAANTPTDQCFNIFSRHFSGLGYTFSLDWQATPTVLAYVSTRRGYKSGGFNETTASANPAYNPEVLRDVETGVKWRWGSGDFRGTLNGDVFYSWYSGIQQQLTAIVNNGAVVEVTNAGKANLYGAEIEANAQLGHLNLSAFYSYIHTKYDKCKGALTAADCFVDEGVDVTDSAFLGTAKNTVSVTARYEIPLGDAGSLNPQATYYYRSKTAYAADNVLNYEAIAPAYSIVNARLEWTDVMGRKGLSVAGYVNNLTNKAYVVAGSGLGGLIGTDTRFYGDPRTYGVDVRFAF